MIIKYLSQEKFEIKSSEAKLTLSREGIDIEGFKIDSPGEYERRGISVLGINPDGDSSMIYLLTIEEMTVLYPSLLNNDINEVADREIGDVDILFVPLGQENTLKLKDSQKLISDIDPRVVIPMLYDDINEFKTAEGIADSEIDVLKIKKIDLPQEERKFYILKPNG